MVWNQNGEIRVSEKAIKEEGRSLCQVGVIPLALWRSGDHRVLIVGFDVVNCHLQKAEVFGRVAFEVEGDEKVVDQFGRHQVRPAGQKVESLSSADAASSKPSSPRSDG